MAPLKESTSLSIAALAAARLANRALYCDHLQPNVIEESPLVTNNTEAMDNLEVNVSAFCNYVHVQRNKHH